ncbi:MAG TPA: hypothetical protein VH207_13450 [Chthoniobacterales bacterium]|nr:hypothetical protein [Chthoniobacterales bacterium]
MEWNRPSFPRQKRPPSRVRHLSRQLGSGSLRADEIDLRRLVSHKLTAEGATQTEDVTRAFKETNAEFLAAVENGRLIGMCSRHELSALHGGRYGFSLFARKPIRELLGCSLLDSLAAVELSTEETS